MQDVYNLNKNSGHLKWEQQSQSVYYKGGERMTQVANQVIIITQWHFDTTYTAIVREHTVWIKLLRRDRTYNYVAYWGTNKQTKWDTAREEFCSRMQNVMTMLSLSAIIQGTLCCYFFLYKFDISEWRIML